MPSVAKITVSPGTTVHTWARSRGNSEPTMPPRVTRLVRAGRPAASACRSTPSGPRQPQLQPAGGRVAVLDRALDVTNPRAFVARHHLQGVPRAIRHDAQRHLTRPGVHQDVPRDLRDGGGDDRLVSAREPGVGGDLTTP